jgi:hypothetical protein
MTGRANGVDPIRGKVNRTARPPDEGDVMTTAFSGRRQVTRPGDEPIALRLVLNYDAMAGLEFGSGSIWAVHGRPFPLVVLEPSR